MKFEYDVTGKARKVLTVVLRPRLRAVTEKRLQAQVLRHISKIVRIYRTAVGATEACDSPFILGSINRRHIMDAWNSIEAYTTETYVIPVSQVGFLA